MATKQTPFLPIASICFFSFLAFFVAKCCLKLCCNMVIHRDLPLLLKSLFLILVGANHPDQIAQFLVTKQS